MIRKEAHMPQTAASRFTYLLLIAMGISIGTGGYVLFTQMMYLLLGIAALVYGTLAVNRVYKVNVQSNVILMLYIAFLLTNALRDVDNATASRLYFNFVVGISAFLLVVKLHELDREARHMQFVPLLSLAIIAGGILLQLNGIIVSRRDGEAMEGVEEGLLLRPGGFLNPNMSAALSLVWLFCAMESKSMRSVFVKTACIAICLFTVSITQSRAAVLCLGAYLLIKMFERGARARKFFGLALGGIGIVLVMTGQFALFDEIRDSIIRRFQGDGSSAERFFLLRTAFATFSDGPVVGHGMRAMLRIAGLGTHNEIVEWLVNFGVTGLVVMLLVVFRFYYVHSFKYVCLCLLPTFLFSHNFFETTAFQVALAYGFTVAAQSRRALPSGASVRGSSTISFGPRAAVPRYITQRLR